MSKNKKNSANMQLLKRITVKDINGKIKYDSGLVPSHSFTIAFLQHIYGALNTIAVSIQDVGDAARSVGAPDDYQLARNELKAGDNTSTYGLVVGTGAGAESNTDYALGTQIAHGVGAGQLDYGAHSFTAPSVVGSNVDMIVSRDFYNGSGGSITVTEVGGYTRSRVGAAYNYFCVLRDLLDTSVPVANTETLTLQYTLRTTV